MSRTNYNNYSKNNVQEEQSVVEELEVAQDVETTATEVEETIVAAPEAPEVVEVMQMSPATHNTGVVYNCSKLNIREMPEVSSRVACIVNADSELVVYDGSYGDFYKVCTASGIEGYCMKDYVSLK